MLGSTLMGCPSASVWSVKSWIAWYLCWKSGAVVSFEIGYLKGKRTPTGERGDVDFYVLGSWVRV